MFRCGEREVLSKNIANIQSLNYKKERGVVKLLKVRFGGQKGRIRPAPSGLTHLQAESPVSFVKALPSHHLCSAEAGQAKT